MCIRDSFNIFIRPVIEFCSLVYHPLLTKKQSQLIERMQKQVVKLAYGWEANYGVVCAAKGIDTLEDRRKKYIDNFIGKIIENPRFADTWFPLRDPDQRGLRDRRSFVESRARTNRFFNSPLSYMRRRANDMLVGDQLG